MTVATSVNRTVVSGNGSATTFAYTFKITSSSHLVVIRSTAAGTDTTLTLGSDYSVTGVGVEAGGSITYPLSGTALPAGDRLIMLRSVPLTQLTDLTNQGAFYAEVHESEFDLLTMADQQLSERLDRAVVVPPSDTGSLVLPNAVTRAGRYFTFDGSGNASTSPIAEVSGSLMAMETTGNGSSTVWTLPASVAGGSRSLVVAVDGVVQPISSYTVSGTTLTFGQAPPLNSAIDVRIIGAPVVVSLADSTQVTATGSLTARTLATRFAAEYEPEDFEAAGDGVTNDSAAFAAAFAALSSTGGVVKLRRGRRYLIDTALTVPDNCSIVGTYTQPGEQLPAASNNYDQLGSSLIINSAVTITLRDAAAIRGCLLIRKGLDLPFADAVAAVAGVAAYAGTAITVGGADAYVGHCMILGFAKAVYSTNFERTRCEYLSIDCTNGIELIQVFDIAYVSHCHAWSFCTSHQSWSSGIYNLRTGSAYRFYNVGDWSKLTDCFAYGYAIGFDIESCDHVNMIGCSVDNQTALVSTAIGYKIHGTSKEALLMGCQVASQGTGVLVNTTAGAQDSCRIIGLNGWANDDYHIRATDGRVIISDCTFYGGVVGVYADATCTGLTVTHCDFQSMTTGIGGDATVVAGATIIGNKYSTVSGGTYRSSLVNGLNISNSTVVVGSSTVTAALQVNGASADAGSYFGSRWTANANPAYVMLAKSRGAAVGTRGAVTTSDNLGNLDFAGDDGTNFQVGGRVSVEVDAAVSAGIVPGRMKFFTATAAGSLSERMRIDDVGFVSLAGDTDTGIWVPAANALTLTAGGTERLRLNATGVGFHGATPIAKPAIAGSRGGNAALADLLTQLAALGLITDSTTA